ncbi:unnamed protein product [Somion occarium]|uniref:GYF domain-containing protein n=1 Tax=Somion occarium TaxID=3059160 RepID=A0ABP1D9U9_9APHY
MIERSAASSDAGPSLKKTRFVEPADDPLKFAEEVDAQLETPSAHRKGRVKTEGYESDSSDEDMFAIGEKEEKKVEEVGKKKKAEYLRLGDIEGQEFYRTGSQSGDEEEEEPEDEDDVERRKKAGMGFELSSFNMREEMEEGKFAADGTYVRTFDPHAVHDRWMDGLDEKEIKRARRSHQQQERIQREKMEAEEQELQQLGGKDQVEKQLIGMLKKGETVLEALQRLGAKAKRKHPATKKKPNNKMKGDLDSSAMVVDIHSDLMKATKAQADIDQITHFASTLMSLGDTDIYSKTYEELVRSIRSTGKVEESWVPPSADVKYEYKWDVPDASAPDGQVFGPYSEEEMKSWYGAAYFGVAGEKIKVRPVAGQWGNWDDVVT